MMEIPVDRRALAEDELREFDSMYEKALDSLRRSLGTDNAVVRASAASIASWNFKKWRRSRAAAEAGVRAEKWIGWAKPASSGES